MTNPLPIWFVTIFAFGYSVLDVLRGAGNVGAIVFIETLFVLSAAYLVHWADAYDPEPIDWVVWAVLFGGGISVAISRWGYSLDSSGVLNTYWAAFLEEATKLMVLLLPFQKNMLRSWTDGFVYGSLAGLGFSFTEDLLYAVASPDGVGTVLFRDLNSVLAHSLFAGIVGAILVAGLQRKNYWLCLISLPAGAAIHGSWNAFVSSTIAESTLVLMLMTPAAYVATAFALRDFERKAIRTAVEKAVSDGRLAESEAAPIWNLRQRKIDRNHLPKAMRSKFDRQISVTLNRIFD